MDKHLKDTLIRKRPIALLIGVIALILSVIGLTMDHAAFYRSYIMSYLFWLGISLGALPMIFLHHLTSGHWGFPIRRTLEIFTKLIPYLALAFIPILFGMYELYEWTHEDVVAHDPILQSKTAYLNTPFFIIRTVFYFAVWCLMAFLLNKWSLQYDEHQDKATFGKLQVLGGVGLVLFGFTASFASIDWVMSMEPHWFSTIYGFMFIIGQTLAGFSLALLLVLGFSKYEPFKKALNQSRAHDLGNLLFALVMLWAYISLSQFIIIWSANLQEEAPWYLKRSQNGWNVLATVLVTFHFFLPFFLLLQRRVKKNFKLLSKLAAYILIVRWLDLLWVIKPAFYKDLSIHWLDVTTFLGIGGIWIWLFLKFYTKDTLTFKNDPVDEQAEGHH